MSAPLDCGIEMSRGAEGYLRGRMGADTYPSKADVLVDASGTDVFIHCLRCG